MSLPQEPPVVERERMRVGTIPCKVEMEEDVTLSCRERSFVSWPVPKVG